MQDLTRSDIHNYIADYLRDLQLDPANELYQKIQKELLHKAEGVFIWVYLVLRNVKKAARYLQYIRQKIPGHAPDIARLSLIANDETLKRFTRPNGIPCVDKWNEMCENTFKTLIPVSARLLEAFHWQTEPNLESPQSEDERKIYTWERTVVNFIHRTAIDFLDSGEANELFGRHNSQTEEPFSVILKADINYCSVVHNDFFSSWAILGS
jgi:hypothetical protein